MRFFSLLFDVWKGRPKCRECAFGDGVEASGRKYKSFKFVSLLSLVSKEIRGSTIIYLNENLGDCVVGP